ncbi:IclR family transcriptional regulator [Modestobacter sp. VKM Ac-2985]|uniref:IclR family transcriptional regulator n=1 Tax=Modestobacter sp. VKM Ac-2985 TaxID=3004139 RepID=UPI0022AB98F9|nr:helix-turn-helix domain-containing protein [Modestobacter sp. VKM Ac-2985]MCZ2839956.1 helix-turn-helix domain-containing protein [Modestobacter sp. VKM Ac-2985]
MAVAVRDERAPAGRPGNRAPVPAESERTLIQAIDRAANVLALLDQDTPRLTAPLVAERLGLNRTTAHRYLQSLQRAGFLSATSGPGPLLDQLSALVSVRQQVITLAPALMRQLADSTGLTAVLSFLGRTGAVVTLVEEPQQTTILLTVRVGTVLEVKAAQTRVLLAFQSDPRAVARAHATLTDAQAAVERTALHDVRRQRLAWADLDRVGLASVAVPVLATYDVQAAMALIGTSTMLHPAGATERVHALQEAAHTLGSLVAG